MKRKIFKTADGSHSIKLPEWEEHYHSKHGAIQEANHVFIKSGLNYYKSIFPKKKNITVLEVGFGTGLNALLTALYAEKNKINIKYIGLEAYPVEEKEWSLLNYPKMLEEKNALSVYREIHKTAWEQEVEISENFELEKRKLFFQDFKQQNCADLIYFDAFGPRVQPELWMENIFINMFEALQENGILVTYSAKGSVRRTLQKIGFQVEKIPGPPGKREMLRGSKMKN